MRTKILFLIFSAIFATAGACFASEFRRATSFEDAYKATCRVSVNGARGTGTFSGIDKENNRALILTNCHVVGRSARASLDFWTNGEKETVQGNVIARYYDARKPADFALIAVNVDDLKRIDPPFVALSGRDGTPGENSFIISAGAPKGRFVQAWSGKTLSYYNGRTIEFTPGPVPGQSGSAIISEIDGELWQTGVLTWLIGEEGADDSKGGAIPISILYECVEGSASASTNAGADVIPPGAVECADKYAAPCVIEFTAENCPPCRAASKEVAELRDAGVLVYVYDVATDSGREMVERYAVDKTPTWLIVDGGWNETARRVGAGHVQELLTLYRDEEDKARKKEAAPKVDVESFRDRPPIYESAGAVGFFDAQDERWVDRLKKRNGEEEDGDKNGNDRGGNGGTEFCPIIKSDGGGIAGNVTSALIERIGAAFDELNVRVADSFRAAIAEQWRDIRFALWGLLTIGSAGGCLLYAVVKRAFLFVVKKPLLNALKAAAQALTSAQEKEKNASETGKSKTAKNGQ